MYQEFDDKPIKNNKIDEIPIKPLKKLPKFDNETFS
jgi:hypothetical protein